MTREDWFKSEKSEKDEGYNIYTIRQYNEDLKGHFIFLGSFSFIFVVVSTFIIPVSLSRIFYP